MTHIQLHVWNKNVAMSTLIRFRLALCSQGNREQYSIITWNNTKTLRKRISHADEAA